MKAYMKAYTWEVSRSLSLIKYINRSINQAIIKNTNNHIITSFIIHNYSLMKMNKI